MMSRERFRQANQKLQHQADLDHERERERHRICVSALLNQADLDHERERERHRICVSALQHQADLDHEREREHHKICITVLQNQATSDHERERERKMSWQAPDNQFGLVQQMELERNEVRKEEINNQRDEGLQAENLRNEQRKTEINNQRDEGLQAENLRNEQRKTEINNQRDVGVQAENLRNEQRKTEINNQRTLALEILEREQPAETQSHTSRSNTTLRFINNARSSTTSSSSNNSSSKSIIERELEKLIQLDSNMSSYDFDGTFICPISGSLMLDPVIVIKTGNTYDRKEIERWFTDHNNDPITNLEVSKNLAPNILVRTQILACLQKLQTEVEEKADGHQHKRPCLRQE